MNSAIIRIPAFPAKAVDSYDVDAIPAHADRPDPCTFWILVGAKTPFGSFQFAGAFGWSRDK